MPELIVPTARLHGAFLECRDEWGPGPQEDGFGVGEDGDLSSLQEFAAWIDHRLRLVVWRPGP